MAEDAVSLTLARHEGAVHCPEVVGVRCLALVEGVGFRA